MRVPHMLLTGVLAVLISVLIPARAGACSCMVGAPVCETFWTTDVVFSGEVLDISRVPNPAGPNYLPHRRVRFRVLQSWRGAAETTMELTTGAGGGDCGYNFEKGVSYIVYAHERGGGLTTGICSRTRPLTAAAEDLEYLKTALQPSVAGRIFGSIRYQRDRRNPGQPPTPIANYEVVLSGGGHTRSTSSGSDGRYEFTGVPAGTYGVGVKIPPGEHAFGPRDVTLADPRGCAAADFYVVPDGRISVRVHDPSGTPLAGVLLDLIDLDAVEPGRPFRSDTWILTDGTGRVEWPQLGPGRYVVAMNATRPPGGRQPYPTTFFPGVAALAEARTLELGLGERVDIGEWTLPAPLREHRVTGRVRWPDGKPAAGAHVSVISSRKSGSAFRPVEGAQVTADQDGRFTLLLHDGVAYEVRAHLNVSNSQQLSAAVPDFTAGRSTEPLELVLNKRSR